MYRDNMSQTASFLNPASMGAEQQELPAGRVHSALVQSFQTRDFAVSLLNDLRGAPCGNSQKDECGPLDIARMAETAATNSEITLRILEDIRRYLLG